MPSCSCVRPILPSSLQSFRGKNEALSLARINKPAFISSLPVLELLLILFSSPSIFIRLHFFFSPTIHFWFIASIVRKRLAPFPLHPHSLNFILSFHPDLCWLCSISDTVLSTPILHHTSSNTHSHHVQRNYHRGSYALPSGLDPGQSCTCAFPSQHVPTFTSSPQIPHPSP